MNSLAKVAVFVSTLIIFGFLSSRLHANNGSFVAKRVSLPAHVLESVYENNRIGRDNWDSHSVHQLYAYQLERRGNASWRDAMAALIKVSQRDGSNSIWGDLCKTYETRTENGCANLVLDYLHEEKHSFLDLMTVWGEMAADDYAGEAETFGRAVSTLQSFTQDFLGSDFEEYTVPLSFINVDGALSILISHDLQRAVIVGTNEGA